MRILVTGAGGMIGSRLVIALKRAGYDVIGLTGSRERTSQRSILRTKKDLPKRRKAQTG